jgi:hypothetical protein
MCFELGHPTPRRRRTGTGLRRRPVSISLVARRCADRSSCFAPDLCFRSVRSSGLECWRWRLLAGRAVGVLGLQDHHPLAHAAVESFPGIPRSGTAGVWEVRGQKDRARLGARSPASCSKPNAAGAAARLAKVPVMQRLFGSSAFEPLIRPSGVTGDRRTNCCREDTSPASLPTVSENRQTTCAGPPTLDGGPPSSAAHCASGEGRGNE